MDATTVIADLAQDVQRSIRDEVMNRLGLDFDYANSPYKKQEDYYEICMILQSRVELAVTEFVDNLKKIKGVK